MFLDVGIIQIISANSYSVSKHTLSKLLVGTIDL